MFHDGYDILNYIDTDNDPLPLDSVFFQSRLMHIDRLEIFTTSFLFWFLEFSKL